MSVATDQRRPAPRKVERTALRQIEFRAADQPEDGDGRTLDGYAAVFNSPTRIDSWEGSFVEQIRPGAFRKTLRETTPVMQFDHGRHPLIGSIPIGTYESVSEDDHGVAVLGRVAENWLMEPIREAISTRAVKGMSFRFEVMREQWQDSSGKVISPDEGSRQYDEEFWRILWMGDAHERGPLTRTLIEVRMPEAGPVVFPAYTDTTVSLRAAELARPILAQRSPLAMEVRSSLALGPAAGTMELPGDDQLRAEIARAVLFGARTAPTATRDDQDAPPAEGHPPGPSTEDIYPNGEDDTASGADPEDQPEDDLDAEHDDAGAETDQHDDDQDDQQSAPADTSGHPDDGDQVEHDQEDSGRSRPVDAPPAPEGHPSLTDQEQRQWQLRQNYLRTIRSRNRRRG